MATTATAILLSTATILLSTTAILLSTTSVHLSHHALTFSFQFRKLMIDLLFFSQLITI